MNNKKILYCITKANFGGAQRYVYELAVEAKKRGHNVAVVFGEPGTLGDKLGSKGIRIISIPSLGRDIGMLKDFKTLLALYKLLKEEKPDVIHLNSSKIGLLGGIAAKFYSRKNKNPKLKTIFTGHGWAFNENRFFIIRYIFKKLHAITIRLANVTIAVSEKTKRDIEDLAKGKKIKVIYNGISRFNLLDGFASQQKIGQNVEEEIWIGSISELHQNKGVDILIKSFSQVASDYPDVALVVIGGGEEKENLKKLVSKLGLQDRVHLLGFVDNARQYLQAFDVFTLTSRTEAFPYALLEAGLAGLPVIASNVGGIPEVITDGQSGLLTEPGDTEAISKAMESILGNPEKRDKLGKNLKQKVETDFSLEQMFNKTFSLYN